MTEETTNAFDVFDVNAINNLFNTTQNDDVTKLLEQIARLQKMAEEATKKRRDVLLEGLRPLLRAAYPELVPGAHYVMNGSVVRWEENYTGRCEIMQQGERKYLHLDVYLQPVAKTDGTLSSNAYANLDYRGPVDAERLIGHLKTNRNHGRGKTLSHFVDPTSGQIGDMLPKLTQCIDLLRNSLKLKPSQFTYEGTSTRSKSFKHSNERLRSFCIPVKDLRGNVLVEQIKTKMEKLGYAGVFERIDRVTQGMQAAGDPRSKGVHFYFRPTPDGLIRSGGAQ